MQSAPRDLSDYFLPIELTCPHDAAGVATLISSNNIGQKERIKVAYDGAVAISASLGSAEVDEPFEDFFHATIPSTNTVTAYNAERLIEAIEPHLHWGCRGTDLQRENFFDMLAGHRYVLSVLRK